MGICVEETKELGNPFRADRSNIYRTRGTRGNKVWADASRFKVSHDYCHGARNIVDKAAKILSEHQPEPLP
jgi:hypothetical protein